MSGPPLQFTVNTSPLWAFTGSAAAAWTARSAETATRAIVIARRNILFLPLGCRSAALTDRRTFLLISQEGAQDYLAVWAAAIDWARAPLKTPTLTPAAPSPRAQAGRPASRLCSRC